MKILINGYRGFMGREVAKLCESGYRGCEAACGVDQTIDMSGSVPCYAGFEAVDRAADCVVDFSHHSCTTALLDYCTTNKLPLVLATTGQTEEELAMIRKELASLSFDEYDRLIQLSDALAGAEGVLDIEQRMEDVRTRYGSYPQRKWDSNLRLKQGFEQKVGKSIYEVVEKDSFRP